MLMRHINSLLITRTRINQLFILQLMRLAYTAVHVSLDKLLVQLF